MNVFDSALWKKLLYFTEKYHKNCKFKIIMISPLLTVSFSHIEFLRRFTWKVDERQIEVGFRRVIGWWVLFLASTTCSSLGLGGLCGSVRRSFGSICSVRRVINYFSCHYGGNLTEWRSVLFLCSSTCGQNTRENTHGEHTHTHTHTLTDINHHMIHTENTLSSYIVVYIQFKVLYLYSIHMCCCSWTCIRIDCLSDRLLLSEVM